MARRKAFSEFSEEEQNYALEQANRVAQGKPSNFYERQGAQEAYLSLLKERPDIRFDVESGQGFRGQLLTEKQQPARTQQKVRILPVGGRSIPNQGPMSIVGSSNRPQGRSLPLSERRSLPTQRVNPFSSQNSPLSMPGTSQSFGNVQNLTNNQIRRISARGIYNRVLSTLENADEGARRELSRLQFQMAREARNRDGVSTKLKRRALAILATLGGAVTNTARAAVYSPRALNRIARDPMAFLRSNKNIGSKFKNGAENFGELLRVSPELAIAKIGSEFYLARGTGRSLRLVGQFTEEAAARLSTQYVGRATTGRILKVTNDGRRISLGVSDRIPSESLAVQAARAGQRVTAISSQGDRLLGNILNTQRTVRKPIPGEEFFDRRTKNLLEKFDAGIITKNELVRLDRLVKRQGAKGLLERSFFADPTGKIRPSRLGILPEGRGRGFVNDVIDSLIEDPIFRKKKPQILLFDNVQVQNFPRALRIVAYKLQNGIRLKPNEANALLRFQLQNSGKFKPVGFVSKESEITLAPGEILQKVRQVGVTIVNGRRVPIIATRVYLPQGATKALINKLNLGRISRKELKLLDKRLKRETGFNYGLSKYVKQGGRYVSLKRLGVSSGLRLLSRSNNGRISKSNSVSGSPRSLAGRSSGVTSIGRDSRGRFLPGSSSGITRSPPRSPPRPGSGTSRFPPSRPPYSPPKTPSRPPRRPPRRPDSPKGRFGVKKGKQQGYYVVEKRAGKYYKVSPFPYSYSDAKDKLAYRLDNKLSRTGKLISAGNVRGVANIRREEKGYFNKFKKHLRPFKISKGRKVPFRQEGYIEVRNKALSTPGEIRQIQLNNLAKGRAKLQRMRAKGLLRRRR